MLVNKKYYTMFMVGVVMAITTMVGHAAEAKTIDLPHGVISDYTYEGNDDLQPDVYYEDVDLPSGEGTGLKAEAIHNDSYGYETKKVMRLYELNSVENTSGMILINDYLKFACKHTHSDFVYFDIQIRKLDGTFLTKLVTGATTLQPNQLHYQYRASYYLLDVDEGENIEIPLTDIFPENVEFDAVNLRFYNFCGDPNGGNELIWGDFHLVNDEEEEVEPEVVEPVYVTITKAGLYTMDVVEGEATPVVYVNGAQVELNGNEIGMLEVGDLLRITVNEEEASVEEIDYQSWNFYFENNAVTVFVEDPPIPTTTTTIAPVDDPDPEDDPTDNETIVDPDPEDDPTDNETIVDPDPEDDPVGEDTCEDVRDDLQQAIDDYEAAETAREEAENNVSDLTGSVIEKNQDIAELNARIAELETENQELQDQVEGIESMDRRGGLYFPKEGSYFVDLVKCDKRFRGAKVYWWTFSFFTGKWGWVHHNGGDKLLNNSYRHLHFLQQRAGTTFKIKLELPDGTELYSTDPLACQVIRNQSANSWNMSFRCKLIGGSKFDNIIFRVKMHGPYWANPIEY